MYSKFSGGGLKFAPLDVNDYHADLVFGAGPSAIERKPLGRLEKILKSPLKDLFLYQGQILSCVHCGLAFQNQYYSVFNSDNPVRLAWRDSYLRVTKGTNRGTDVKEACEIYRKDGVCEDKFAPNFPFKSLIEMLEQVKETNEIKLNRIKYRIKNYFRVSNASINNLYFHLQRTIVGVAIGGNNDDFSGYFKRVNFTGTEWYHYCLLLDVVGDSNRQVLRDLGFPDNQIFNGDWISLQAWNENRLDIRLINSKYPILFGQTLEDFPDDLDKDKIRMSLQLVKASNDSRVYLVDSQNIKHWIKNEATFNEYFKDFSQVLTVESQQIDPLQEGEPIDVNESSLSEALATLIKQFSIKVGQAFGKND